MHATGGFEGYGVLIRGAARGVGAATARRPAGEGAQVLVTDVDLAAAERAVGHCGAPSGARGTARPALYDPRSSNRPNVNPRNAAARYPIASTIPSQNRDRASSASVAVSTASCHRESSPPHRSATMAMAIGVCSSPSTSMCRAR